MGQQSCCQSESDQKTMVDLTAARQGQVRTTDEAEEAAQLAETAGPPEVAEAECFVAAAPPLEVVETSKPVGVKPASFSVMVDRDAPDTSFGTRVDPSDGKILYISSLEPGETLVSRYNERVSQDLEPGEQVVPGYYIVEINGKRGDARQLEALLATSGKISAVLAKPTLYDCHVNKNGKSLGLELRYPCNYGTSLLVEQILQDGAAQGLTGWTRPQPNDRIISVNGKTGGCYSLLEEIKKSTDTVQLGMSRLIQN